MTADTFVIHPDDVVAVSFPDIAPYVTVAVEEPIPFGAILISGPQGPQGTPGPGEPVMEILPANLQNGQRTTFDLLQTARNPMTVAVLRNGLAEVYGVGFTATHSTITFTTAPLGTDVVVVRYEI